MVRGFRKVTWDKTASESFRTAINYIRQDSIKNAEKVKLELITNIKALSVHPEKYPSDKYKLNNDGSYRAFELHHYRVTYRILQTGIRVIAVRHTSMEPKDY